MSAFVRIAARLETIPTATSGTPERRMLQPAPIANNPYEASQSTIATGSGVRQGIVENGKATSCSAIAA